MTERLCFFGQAECSKDAICDMDNSACDRSRGLFRKEEGYDGCVYIYTQCLQMYVCSQDVHFTCMWRSRENQACYAGEVNHTSMVALHVNPLR